MYIIAFIYSELASWAPH